MPTITMRVDQWTRDELDRVAQATDTTLSDLLRLKIDELLGKDVEPHRAGAPRSLTLTERRTWVLQHEILALLKTDADEVNYHRKRIEVLESGFTAEYGAEFVALGPELTPSDCRLVWDILDMFSVLEASVDRLSPDDLAGLGELAGRLLSFRGFDGNDERESRMLDYTQFLIDDGKWENLAKHLGDGNDGGNSHMPVLDGYQRMLHAFAPIWRAKVSRGLGLDAHRFNADELKQVLAALRVPRA